MNEAGFWYGSFDLSLPTLCCELACEGIWVHPKIRVLPSATLSQTLDLENFATASQLCCQQNSSTVEFVGHTYDGRRVVAGRTKIIYMSVDRNALTPSLRFVVLLIVPKLCSS